MKKLAFLGSVLALLGVSCGSSLPFGGVNIIPSVDDPTLKVELKIDNTSGDISSKVEYVVGNASFSVAAGSAPSTVVGYKAVIYDEQNNIYATTTQGGFVQQLPGGFYCPAAVSATNSDTLDLTQCGVTQKVARDNIIKNVPLPSSLLPDVTNRLSQDCLKRLLGMVGGPGLCPQLKIVVEFTVKSHGNQALSVVSTGLTSMNVKGSAVAE